MKVYLDKYGQITEKQSDYEAELTGSYRYSFIDKCYQYEVINSTIPLKYVTSENLIDFNLKNK